MTSLKMQTNAHRGGLPTEVAQIWPRRDLFERLGGREVLAAIIDDFYERLGKHPALRALFKDALKGDRANQKMFFEEWMGGEPRYSRKIGGPGTGPFHDGFHITRPQAGRWLALFTTTLRDHDISPELVREILQGLGPMAQAIARRRERYPLTPSVRRAAAYGNVEHLLRMVEADPQLFVHAPREASHCLFRAARAGKLEVVRFFVEQGVDLNRPFSPERTQLIPWHIAKGYILITPWCVAKAGEHEEVADFLHESGAVIDIFSLAYLGDLQGLREMLEENPKLAACHDPATDHRQVTPLHHASWAEKSQAVELLRRYGAE